MIEQLALRMNVRVKLIVKGIRPQLLVIIGWSLPS